MEDKDLEKIESLKNDIKKCIDKLFTTTSLNVETQTTNDLIKLVSKIEHSELIDFTSELDVFGKCVMHYRLPIEMRMDVELSRASAVDEFDRKVYWKDYKSKLNKQVINSEEEYNKIIMMACILHVPIEDEDDLEENK